MREICLKVLSWNLHGLAWPLSRDPGGRMDRVSAKVRELSPDVVLLQEVWLGSHADRLSTALQPDWTPICSKRRGGGPRGGLLTFVRAAAGWHTLVPPEFHAFSVSAPVWKIWEGDGLGGKGVLAVELERGEQRICAVNTHLQSQYSGINYAEVREVQLIEPRRLMPKQCGETSSLSAARTDASPSGSRASNIAACHLSSAADSPTPASSGQVWQASLPCASE